MHVAAKFGSIDCLQVLLEYSQCDVKKSNKDGKLVEDVLCERKGDEETKRLMRSFLDNRFYVNLVRQSDIFGFMNDVLQVELSFGKLFANDPILRSEQKKKQRTICAIAGPMDKSSAKELKEKFKSPMNRSLTEIQVKLTDPNNGCIRIARNYCYINEISWKEFWPFLNQMIDLTSDRGLQLLERHLSSKLKVCLRRVTNKTSLLITEFYFWRRITKKKQSKICLKC
jgi:hypothetical protein